VVASLAQASQGTADNVSESLRADVDPKSPYLIVAAFWSDTDVVDEVAEVVSHDHFPRPEGRRGAVVSFRNEIADRPDFKHVLERLDLREANERDYAGYE
jgi:hypothetical protein